ncbi:TetR family transcriptional regulator C-terminal domain-containing protein [Streptomyces sp. NBC_01591]|uniref:TetR family transcriptional regulator C-terminal domain-containing protein n=1 Tax=Streptomyces sp. NBC_01591 TaxID=2975888 RepID=UPI002DD9CAD8|nr:TetR family transcriptional regulator C-terminal domain-containing protein [Streptomyces sp. NBC_01591]
MAEAFGTAAGAELNTLLPTDRTAETPTDRLARFFALATGAAYDDISRLWINARHLSRYRPALRDRVGHQEALWRGRLEDLVRDGVECGDFRTADPYVATIQILVVIDGLGAHANTETADRPEAVTRMAVSTAERELGLESGTLTRRSADTSGGGRGAPSTGRAVSGGS